jgi:predicted HicB family RNase H-like nuclease
MRSQINLRIPPTERASVQAQARDYGISLSAYLRILAIEDRARQERKQMMGKSHPNGR